MRVYPMSVEDNVRLKMTPARGFDLGSGPGKPHEATASGGVVGLMIDTRGRPFTLPTDESKRVEKLDRWAKAFDAYPE